METTSKPYLSQYTRYNQLVNTLDSEYWKRLKLCGITPTKYSWKFDREGFCDKLFAQKKEKIFERGNLFESALKDGFLPRFCSRGFSAQAGVPQELHNKVMEELLADFRDKYGDDFADICFKGVEDDMVITIYTK